MRKKNKMKLTDRQALEIVEELEADEIPKEQQINLALKLLQHWCE